MQVSFVRESPFKISPPLSAGKLKLWSCIAIARYGAMQLGQGKAPAQVARNFDGLVIAPEKQAKRMQGYGDQVVRHFDGAFFYVVCQTMTQFPGQEQLVFIFEIKHEAISREAVRPQTDDLINSARIVQDAVETPFNNLRFICVRAQIPGAGITEKPAAVTPAMTKVAATGHKPDSF